MRSVLHVAPLVEPIAERFPGGAEKCAFDLAGAQARSGWRVSMIAARDSVAPPGVTLIDLDIPPGKLIPVDTSRNAGIHPYKDQEIKSRQEMEEVIFGPVLTYVREHRKEFDCVHNHAYDALPLLRLGECGVPVLHTLHLPPSLPWVNEGLRGLGKNLNPSLRFVTVSRGCADEYDRAVGFRPGVIYNSVDTSQIGYRREPGDHFIWVGRISPEKGLHTALDVVVDQLKARLVVIGRVYDDGYFRTRIRGRLKSRLVDYRGYQPHGDVIRALGTSRALVYPIEWAEPFGLVMVEALAAGTPVVAYDRGAAGEIVEKGKTGYLARDLKELGEALERIDLIDRAQCRRRAEERFSLEAMAKAYELEYAALK